ncbi:MAG: hypothetical protein ACFCU1_14410 [Sumerlaeia bacterium]
MRHNSALSLAFVLLSITAPLAACTVCVAAHVDKSFPAAGWWSVLAIIWYMLLAGFLRNENKPLASSLLGALGTMLILAITGALIFAQIPFLLLYVIILYRLLMGWRAGGIKQRRSLALGGALIVFFLATAAFAAYQTRFMDDADYIIRWQGTHTARLWTKQLAAHNNAPQLRKVVTQAEHFEASEAAKSLAQIGTPNIDAPIIHQAMVSAANSKDASAQYTLTTFSESLEQLLSTKAPGNGTPEDWEPRVTEAAGNP